jgi:hypothetical protein
MHYTSSQDSLKNKTGAADNLLWSNSGDWGRMLSCYRLLSGYILEVERLER